MSRLFGPLSETISSVSCRLCAFAGENTAGAAMPAAAAETDLRKSRRFMCRAPARMVSEGDSARDVPDPRDALTQQLRYCYCWVLRPVAHPFQGSAAQPSLHPMAVDRVKLKAGRPGL